MATAVTANRAELIAIADAVAREKSIDRTIVIEAMEDAIQRAARARYGAENDIRAKIDPKGGETRLWRVLEVVEEPEDFFKQIDLKGALKKDKDAKLGDFIVDPLPPVEFGRIAAQAAKQVIVQKVRDAERDRQFEEFKDRQGEIITGVVKRAEFGHVVVDLGKAEGVIRRDQQIPREVLKPGDRVRSLIASVRREPRGPQIFLSRSAGDFMKKLFAQEVPEIYDGIIEIKAVARDPGSRAKIGVISRDSSIDPVGACVGMKGSRVQAVVQELQGEKIDIIPWSPDVATFVVNALQPAEVAKVVMSEDDSRIDVVVPDDQLSLAIGRRGQNVRLASQLTGRQIDIMTEADESERRQKEFTEKSAMFESELDVDETLAQLLVAEGFSELEEVAYVEISELASIEGFDDDLAGELQNRAVEALDRREAAAREERVALGVEDDVAAIEGLSEAMLVVLGKKGVKTLDDLGDLATDELVSKTNGILKDFGMSEDDGNRIIMAARAHWFEDANPPGRTHPRMEHDEHLTADIIVDDAAPGAESTAVPERRCILTGAHGPRAALIRLAMGPDNQIAADLGAKLPGRGAWIAADRALLEAAMQKGKLKGALARAFKSNALRVPDDLADQIAAGLERRALDRLGLENKSGNLIWGHERVGEAILKGKVRLLLHAADARPDGMSKLEARRRGASPDTVSIVLPVGREQLSMALGRENVVHAAIGESGSAARVIETLERWAAFNGTSVTSARNEDENDEKAVSAVADAAGERH